MTSSISTIRRQGRKITRKVREAFDLASLGPAFTENPPPGVFLRLACQLGRNILRKGRGGAVRGMRGVGRSVLEPELFDDSMLLDLVGKLPRRDPQSGGGLHLNAAGLLQGHDE